ncbi:hypothetical protein IFO70_01460 [Phormidium tenue FACHB-886]|nr:hypothetical protein [Phormidium tenue FACHB-886]
MDELTGLSDSNWVPGATPHQNDSKPASNLAETTNEPSSLDEKILTQGISLNDWLPDLKNSDFKPVVDASTKSKGLTEKLGLGSSARLGKRFLNKISGQQSIEILQVTHLCQNKSEHFRWGWVSALQPGDRFEGSSILVEGWLVGKFVQPIAMRFHHNQAAIAEVPINVPRPDVMKVHFYEPEFCNCGFRGSLDLSNISGAAEIHLDAVFPDGNAVPAGAIRLYKCN